MRDRGDRELYADELEEGGRLDSGSFLTGMLLGAAIGAGVALLFAPASGEETRRLVRKRTRKLGREARKGFTSARAEARRMLRDKKEALRERLEEGLERVEDHLGV